MKYHWLSGCLVVLATGGLAMPVAAQEDPPPLTTAAAVLKLGNSEARQRALPVAVTGVVTFVTPDRDWFFVQDASAGIRVIPDKGLTRPSNGQVVEVTGRTKAGTFVPLINAKSVRVIGQAEMPVARPVVPSQLQAQKEFGQWVEVEGIVLDAVHQQQGDVLMLTITGAGGSCILCIHNAPEKLLRPELREMRVKARGVNWVQYYGDLQVPSPAFFTLSGKGRAELFDRAELSIATVPSGPLSDTERVRVRATVLFADALGDLCVRTTGGTYAIVAVLQLLDRQPSDSKGIEQPPAIYPGAGTVVDFVATPVKQPGGLLRFQEAQLKELAYNQPVPPAVPARLADLADPAQLGALITVRGTLTKIEDRRMIADKKLPVLTLADKESLLEVICTEEALPALWALAPGEHAMKCTGYLLPGTQGGSSKPQLWLRAATDAVAAGRSPAAWRRLAWWLTGSAIAGLLTLGASFWALREKLQRRRIETAQRLEAAAAISRLNATLEQRVAERTTQLEQANARLREAGDELVKSLVREKELGELKSSFVSMVSHEFRTPLAVILSSTELLRNHLARLPEEKRHQQLQSIHGSTLHMARLIDEVLLLGKVEAGKMEFSPRPLDLRTLCEQLADETLSATQGRCPIKLELAPNVPGEVTGDEALLRHILSNLLSNAVKYSPAGAEVAFLVHVDGGDAVFTITDRGIGIPEADQKRIFQAFHRAANVGQVSGTGLGLVIVQRCVELHGGTVSLESPSGQGTTFVVRLPVIHQESKAKAGEAAYAGV